MKDSIFLDSNLLVYYVSDRDKALVIKDILVSSAKKVISTQVLNEFTNVCIKKKILHLEDVINLLNQFVSTFDEVVYLTPQTIFKALELKQKYSLQFYDSLIVATALESNCHTLYSEDMQNGLKIENILTITNPFI